MKKYDDIAQRNRDLWQDKQNGKTSAELRLKYGISLSQVETICADGHRFDLGKPTKTIRFTDKKPKISKFAERNTGIYNDYLKSMPRAEIATKHGVSKKIVDKVIYSRGVKI